MHLFLLLNPFFSFPPGCCCLEELLERERAQGRGETRAGEEGLEQGEEGLVWRLKERGGGADLKELKRGVGWLGLGPSQTFFFFHFFLGVTVQQQQQLKYFRGLRGMKGGNSNGMDRR